MRFVKAKIKDILYVHIKQKCGPESNVASCLSSSHYSCILPLAIEAGRFKNIQEEFKLYKLCNLAEVESKSHSLLYCTNYDELRKFILHEMP